MLYLVGKIVNTHGIRGELKVASNTDFIEERFAKGSTLFICENDKVVAEEQVASYRIHKGMILVKFEGKNNINDVEQYKGLELFAEDPIEDLDDEEYYYSDIIGAEVFFENDEKVGKVVSVMETGANDVWEIKKTDGKTVLIPVIDEVILEVNVDDNKIIIAEKEGLLD